MDLDKQGGETVLVLLDLSAAFDTIDLTVLINRLRSRYGVGYGKPKGSLRVATTRCFRKQRVALASQ